MEGTTVLTTALSDMISAAHLGSELLSVVSKGCADDFINALYPILGLDGSAVSDCQ